MESKIEILSTSLLDENRKLVQELRETASRLGLEFGWHYLLDLTWIISQLGEILGKSIMDAGAGVGVMQWYLAKHGAVVTSVDRGSRADLHPRFRGRYRVHGLRKEDLHSTTQVLSKQFSDKQMRGLISSLGHLITGPFQPKGSGEIKIYNQDLRNLLDIPADTYDAVVAVSALEHNTPENLKVVVQELMRVIQPGGVLLATLCAAQEKDWFHEASQGWCYTAESLRRIFQLPEDTPDNYARYDELFENLAQNAELKENLASFYARSGDNGMPWGLWNPQYQPVGVCKIKEMTQL